MKDTETWFINWWLGDGAVWSSSVCLSDSGHEGHPTLALGCMGQRLSGLRKVELEQNSAVSPLQSLRGEESFF